MLRGWLPSVAKVATRTTPRHATRRSGGTEFVLEAWDGEAAQLLVLDGHTVVVEGRLAADSSLGTKVVAYRLKVRRGGACRGGAVRRGKQGRRRWFGGGGQGRPVGSERPAHAYICVKEMTSGVPQWPVPLP